MIAIALTFTFGCFALALVLNLWRVIRAPGVPDRVLALDTMVVNVIALLVLYGIYQGTAVYFEAAVLIAMVGFVSTVAYAKFMLRGDIVE
ncbi:K+/H+ antiporter subunit F [Phaeovulum sp.]|uniref:K+/H+ antiporter subunit F n=1 Tax=Phaeovulum sp. TaxID=2934796 RepID=UPI0035679778